MYVLLVTWLIAGQPPSSYQHEFSSLKTCGIAKMQVEMEADRLKREQDQREAEAAKNGVKILMRAQPPEVSAFCTPK